MKLAIMVGILVGFALPVRAQEQFSQQISLAAGQEAVQNQLGDGSFSAAPLSYENLMNEAKALDTLYQTKVIFTYPDDLPDLPTTSALASDSASVTAQPTPEPSTIGLGGLAMGALVLGRKRAGGLWWRGRTDRPTVGQVKPAARLGFQWR